MFPHPALPAGLLLRPAAAADVPALAALYAAAAAACGPAVYAAEQVAAWVAFGADGPAFADDVLGAETWVAVAAPQPGAEAGREPGAVGSPAGFCGWLAPPASPAPAPAGPAPAPAELRSLYVHPAWHRRGIGAALLEHALSRAAASGAARIEAWVTPVSRPVFERAGFVLLRTERQPWGGVAFERYRVGRGRRLKALRP